MKKSLFRFREVAILESALGRATFFKNLSQGIVGAKWLKTLKKTTKRGDYYD